jgi:hypothetical protein
MKPERPQGIGRRNEGKNLESLQGQHRFPGNRSWPRLSSLSRATSSAAAAQSDRKQSETRIAAAVCCSASFASVQVDTCPTMDRRSLRYLIECLHFVGSAWGGVVPAADRLKVARVCEETCCAAEVDAS